MMDERWRSVAPAPVTTALVTLIVAWYVVELGVQSASRPWITYWFTMSSPVPASPGWVTSLVTHADFRHLVGNVLTIAVFGQWAERLLGPRWFFGFVLVTGYSANIAQTLVGAGTAVAGASGVVFAAMTYVPLVLFSTERLPRPEKSWRVLATGQASRAEVTSVLLGMAFLVALVSPVVELTPLVAAGRTGSVGHLVAAILGVVVGYWTWISEQN